MARELNHDEAQDLLGAYALDAIDGDEREAVERHLIECAPCRAEVSEHREVAALMAGTWAPPPEGLWDRISSALAEPPPPMRPVVRLDEERARRRRPFTFPFRAVAAVAAVAVAATIGVVAVQTLATGDGVDDVAELAQSASERPDARSVTMTSTDGRLVADAVLLPDGSGYVVDTNLPALPAGRTYQLWAVVGGERISVGVLGPAPGPAAFHTSGDVAALAITEEEAGGVVVSRQQPTVVGTVA